MFHEHRLYFEQADLDTLSKVLQNIDIPFLGRECVEIEGTPVFQFQTEQVLPQETRNLLVAHLMPRMVSWNNELTMSFHDYQEWLHSLDETALSRLRESSRRSDLARMAIELGHDKPTNHIGDSTHYVNPKVSLEVIERLKASLSAQDSQQTLEALGCLTNRDLFFYSLGRITGFKKAEDALLPLLQWHKRVKAGE